MLNKLELQNFRAFGELAIVPFAPITLIYGENSAGKSSVLQALNLLKQTVEGREAEAALLPRVDSGIVDLGSFQELLFDHDLDRSLRLRLDASAERRAFYHPFKNVDDCGIEVSFRRPSLDDEVRVESFSVYFGSFVTPIARFEACSVSELTKDERRRFVMMARPFPGSPRGLGGAAKCVEISREPQLWSTYYDLCRQQREVIHKELERELREISKRLEGGIDSQSNLFDEEELTDPELPAHKKTIEKAISFYEKDFSLESYIARMVEGQLGTLIGFQSFLPVGRAFGPEGEIGLPEISFRSRRMRQRRDGEILLDVRAMAISASRVVERGLEKLFPLGPYRRPPERWYMFTGTSPKDVGYSGKQLPDLLFRHRTLLEECNGWLERLGIDYRLEVRNLGQALSDLFEIRLVDTRRTDKIDVGLPDVGFGISQILPFIVQSLFAEEQTISIEQPEVHIHPKLQARLADLLASTIKKERNNQFLVETHSEHLVLRLQNLIKEKELKPEDVAVIYVSRGENGSRVQRLRLDDEGDFIDEWPGGFFEERYDLIFGGGEK